MLGISQVFKPKPNISVYIPSIQCIFGVCAVEEGHVDGSVADNVAESGEDSEDEWNYFKGEGEREEHPSEEPDEVPHSETPCQDNVSCCFNLGIISTFLIIVFINEMTAKQEYSISDDIII